MEADDAPAREAATSKAEDGGEGAASPPRRRRVRRKGSSAAVKGASSSSSQSSESTKGGSAGEGDPGPDAGDGTAGGSTARRPRRRRTMTRRRKSVGGDPEGDAGTTGGETAPGADEPKSPRKRKTRKKRPAATPTVKDGEEAAAAGRRKAAGKSPAAKTSEKKRKKARSRKGAGSKEIAEPAEPARKKKAAKAKRSSRSRRSRRGKGGEAEARPVGVETELDGSEAPDARDEEGRAKGRRSRTRRRKKPVAEGSPHMPEVVDSPEDHEADAIEPMEPAKPVEKMLLVNAADPEEVRIALLEDGRIEELYVEGMEERSATGNVYRGRVQNVEQGIGAAFVDLGRGLTGFLHVSDLPNRTPGASITDLIEPGQEVLVQITRDSIGRKGPALTGRIALPGRYLVLMAHSARSGVSRRIGRGRVRDRARRLLEGLDLPEGMGLIVRTAGEECTLADLQRDLAHLVQEWKRIEAVAAQTGPPTLLRAESDIAERSIRDIMPMDTTKIVVDREDLAARIRALLGAWYGPIPLRRLPGESDVGEVSEDEAPEASDAAEPEPTDEAEEDEAPRPMPEVVVHETRMPIFHDHGLEAQLEEAFRRSVRLPSGGSIVIDPTEALVAIDVNSGRFTGEPDPEATALQTNLEAAEEAARQLRLRDLGGLIVLDLIDMRDRRAARKVEKTLKQALARDRARIRVGRIGPFGCLILSRQRIRQALSRVTHEECAECGGTGRRRHQAGLGLRVLREMQARASRAQGRGGLEVRVPRAVKDWIQRHRASALKEIEASVSGPIRLEADPRLAADGWAMKGLPPSGRGDS